MFIILHDLQVHHGLFLPLDKHVQHRLKLIVTGNSFASDPLQNILGPYSGRVRPRVLWQPLCFP